MNRIDPFPEAAAGEKHLAAINRFSRRKLSPDEVFVFAVNLCDNEVDRDGERFTRPALEALAPMMLGKTGIFDHNPQGAGQTARIFYTQVVEDPSRETSCGEPFCQLRALCYLPRCEKNADLILEIDAGIKKEVSIGCAVAKKSCSICGAAAGSCGHKTGERYGGQLCCTLLEEPTDAYEWSFVAVPAQREAGVTKAYGTALSPGELKKKLALGEVTLKSGEAKALLTQLERLETLAQAGEEYLSSLRREVEKALVLQHPALTGTLAQKAAASLSCRELQSFLAGLGKDASLLVPQLYRPEGTKATSNRHFKL